MTFAARDQSRTPWRVDEPPRRAAEELRYSAQRRAHRLREQQEAHLRLLAKRWSVVRTLRIFYSDWPGALWSAAELADALECSRRHIHACLAMLRADGDLVEWAPPTTPDPIGRSGSSALHRAILVAKVQGGEKPLSSLSDQEVKDHYSDGLHDLDQGAERSGNQRSVIRARAHSPSASAPPGRDSRRTKLAAPIPMPQLLCEQLTAAYGYEGCRSVLEVLREGWFHERPEEALLAARTLPWRRAKDPAALLRVLFVSACRGEPLVDRDAEAARTRACEMRWQALEFAWAGDLATLDDEALVAHYLELDSRIGALGVGAAAATKNVLLERELGRVRRAIAARPSASRLLKARSRAPKRTRYEPPHSLDELDDDALRVEIAAAADRLGDAVDHWDYTIVRRALAAMRAELCTRQTRLVAASENPRSARLALLPQEIEAYFASKMDTLDREE